MKLIIYHLCALLSPTSLIIRWWPWRLGCGKGVNIHFLKRKKSERNTTKTFHGIFILSFTTRLWVTNKELVLGRTRRKGTLKQVKYRSRDDQILVWKHKFRFRILAPEREVIPHWWNSPCWLKYWKKWTKLSSASKFKSSQNFKPLKIQL